MSWSGELGTARRGEVDGARSHGDPDPHPDLAGQRGGRRDGAEVGEVAAQHRVAAPAVAGSVPISPGQQPQALRGPRTDLRAAQQVGDRAGIVALHVGQRREVLADPRRARDMVLDRVENGAQLCHPLADVGAAPQIALGAITGAAHRGQDVRREAEVSAQRARRAVRSDRTRSAMWRMSRCRSGQYTDGWRKPWSAPYRCV